MTFRAAVLTAALVFATTGAAFAFPSTPWKQAEVFATCTGRFNALAARQNAIGHPELEETLSTRNSFRQLLDAVLPEALSHGVAQQDSIRWQSIGWSDIAYQLADELYSSDPHRAARARETAQRRIAECQAMLL